MFGRIFTWRFARMVGFCIAAWMFVVCAFNAWHGTVTLTGETALLSNVPIEYVTTGRWIYPLHAQPLFYPGVERFMIHPPLHYAMAALVLQAFGIGVWQIELTSFVTATIALLAAAGLVWRFFGLGAGIITLALSAGLQGFYMSATQLRPDATFGLFYGLTVATLGWALLARHTSRNLLVLSFAIGALCVATLSVHWYGYFVQLYLPAFFAAIWIIRKPPMRLLFMVGLAVSAGWALAMGAWWLSWGDELPRSLIFVLIKGRQFLDILDMPVSRYFSFLTEWDGGTAALIGLALGVLTNAGSCIKSLTTKTAPPLADRIASLLIANLVAYWLFFVVFVANKDPQYGANIYPLLLPVCAYGYAQAIAMMFAWFKAERWRDAGAIVVATTIAASSPMTHAYATVLPRFEGDPNSHFRGMRQALGVIVPQGFETVLGGNAYPYLYDRPYRSTFQLVGERFLIGRPRSNELTDLIDFYGNMPGQDYRTATFSSTERARAIAQSAALVTSDISHSYQWYFYDTATWRDEYVEAATVFALAPASPLPYERGEFFTIAIRRDRLDEAIAANPEVMAASPAIYRSGPVLLLTFDPARNRRPTLTDEDYNPLTGEQRRGVLANYFDAMGWFGAALSGEEKASIVDALFPAFDSQMTRYVGVDYNGVALTRTVGQSVDYVLSNSGIPEALARAARHLPESS
jgi:hypothetical protein